MLKSSLAETREIGLAMDDIPELEASAQERDIFCIVNKLTYADGRAYRYLISDGDRQLRYVAKRTGLLLPGQTRLTEFFDTEENPVGCLQPPEAPPWSRAKNYQVYISEEAEEPFAMIRERWRVVDILLLRMPRYEVKIGEHRYIAEGNRYDTAHLYGLFPIEEEDEESQSEEELEPEPEWVTGGAAEEASEPETENQETEEWSEGGESIEEIIQESAEEESKPERVKVGQIQCPAAGPSYIVQTEAEPLRQTPLVLAALVALIDMERYS
jgi:hypothetical protein